MNRLVSLRVNVFVLKLWKLWAHPLTIREHRRRFQIRSRVHVNIMSQIYLIRPKESCISVHLLCRNSYMLYQPYRTSFWNMWIVAKTSKLTRSRWKEGDVPFHRMPKLWPVAIRYSTNVGIWYLWKICPLNCLIVSGVFEGHFLLWEEERHSRITRRLSMD